MPLGRSSSRAAASFRRYIDAPMVTVAALLVCGCSGGDPYHRIPVHGTVLLPDGSPVTGAISLLPESGHHGPAATASIDEGRYAFTEKNGPVAGPHRVVVQLDPPKKSDLMGASSGGRAAPPMAKTFRWEMRVDVPDQGPFPYNVQLE